MLNQLFEGIFDTTATTISVPEFLLCVTVSLVIGIFLALVYMYKSRYTRSFVVTLAMLPAVVCVVIMMVNGNVGAGVAVAGAFSLVRFRSWYCKRDRNDLPGNGCRSCSWNGLLRIRSSFCPCFRTFHVPDQH